MSVHQTIQARPQDAPSMSCHTDHVEESSANPTVHRKARETHSERANTRRIRRARTFEET